MLANRMVRTVFRGEGLALQVQDEGVAGAGALCKLLGLHPDPPVLGPRAISDEVLVERGVACADDFTQEALDSTQKIRLGSVFYIFGWQVFLVIDVQDDDLQKLLALKGKFLLGGRVYMSDALHEDNGLL